MSARTIDDLEQRTLAELWQSCDQNAIQFMNLINEFIGRRAGHVEHSPAPSKWFEREQAKKKKIDAWRDHSCASSFVPQVSDDDKSNLNCSIDSGSEAGKESPTGRSRGELAAPDDEDKLNSSNLKGKINKSDEQSDRFKLEQSTIASEKQKCMNNSIAALNSPIKRFEFADHINEQENHKIQLTAGRPESVCSNLDCFQFDSKFTGSKAEAKTRAFAMASTSDGNARGVLNKLKNKLNDSCTPTHSPQSGNVFTRSDNFAGLPAIDRMVDLIDDQQSSARRLETERVQNIGGASATIQKIANQKTTNQKTGRTEDCYNGSNVYDFKSNELLYSWSQSLSDLDISVPLPRCLTSKRQCRVTIRSNALTVAFETGQVQDGLHHANISGWTARLDGQLTFAIRTSTACWTLDLSGRCLRLFLEKQQDRWWKCCLVKGEPELDLNALERTIAYDQLTNEEQNVIQQLTYRSRLSADSNKQIG